MWFDHENCLQPKTEPDASKMRAWKYTPSLLCRGKRRCYFCSWLGVLDLACQTQAWEKIALYEEKNDSRIQSMSPEGCPTKGK